jgi:hypothetical protein
MAGAGASTGAGTVAGALLKLILIPHFSTGFFGLSLGGKHSSKRSMETIFFSGGFGIGSRLNYILRVFLKSALFETWDELLLLLLLLLPDLE